LQNQGAILILYTIASAIIEEIIFRSYVLRKLNYKENFFRAAFISSFLFSLAHVDAEKFLTLLIIGMHFCFIYDLFGNIWNVSALHAGFNMMYRAKDIDVEKFSINYLDLTKSQFMGALIILNLLIFIILMKIKMKYNSAQAGK